MPSSVLFIKCYLWLYSLNGICNSTHWMASSTLLIEWHLRLWCLSATSDSDASLSAIFDFLFQQMSCLPHSSDDHTSTWYAWLCSLNATFGFAHWMLPLTLLIECYLQLYWLNGIFNSTHWVASSTLMLECYLWLWCLSLCHLRLSLSTDVMSPS